MQLTTLGATGLRVSRVAIGCAGFGINVSDREAEHLVLTALDAGIGFFDTADIYAEGESERILGKALRHHRDAVVVATKFRHAGPQPGAGRKSIRVALEASLRRLRFDYVDLYQLHAPDPATPIEETVGALQDLVSRGMILSFGICNASAWELVDAQRVAWANGGPGLAAVQAPMNAIDTSKLEDLRPVAARFQVGLLAATPLARGLLGRDYGPDRPPQAGHPLRSPKGVSLWTEDGFAQAARVRSLAQELGLSAAQTAIGVLLAQKEISAVLFGPRSPADIQEIASLRHEAVSSREARRLLRGHGDPQ